MTIIDQRLQQMESWLKQQINSTAFTLEALPGDASFRRYFRLYYDKQTFIIMDAPTDKEDCNPFVQIAFSLYKLNINVPRVLAKDLKQGFLLLTDLGDCLYLHALANHDPDDLYQQAIQTLLTLQTCSGVEGRDLSCFNHHFIQEELNRFTEWFLKRQLNLNLTNAEETMLQAVYDELINIAQSQPQTFIHRDYHSRNLMLMPDTQVGVLDFQDAMWGPITYDLVSLLRDCYISWSKTKVKAWALSYWQQAQTATIVPQCDQQQFLSWFDLMGVQRHLKVLGIFARLNQRDNKPSYLKDIPRILDYILDVADDYPILHTFKHFLTEKVAHKIERFARD